MSIKPLRDAVGFLTRVPVRPGPDLAPAVPWFPLVGAAVGAAAGAVRWAAGPLGPLAATVLAVVAAVAVTGALHEDGLADLADALPASDRDRRFQILDDPRAGTFGVLSLVSVMLLRVGVLTPLPAAACARTLVAAHAIGRAAAVASTRLLPPASDGLGGRATGRWTAGTAIAVGMTAVGATALAGSWVVLGAAGPAAAVLLAVRRRLGGITGDGMGAVAVVAEIGALAGGALWLH